MSLVAGNIGEKVQCPDGIQVDHLSENTVGHGTRVRGISDPTTYPVIAGDVGETIVSAAFNTPLGQTPTYLTSISLNKGVYNISGSFVTAINTAVGVAYIRLRIIVGTTLKGYAQSPTAPNGNTNLTSQFVCNSVVISADNTPVYLEGFWSGTSGLLTFSGIDANIPGLSAVRIA